MEKYGKVSSQTHFMQGEAGHDSTFDVVAETIGATRESKGAELRGKDKNNMAIT